MGDVFVFAFTAALNPTLLAASTLMMLLERPVKLMLGYLLGALITSITLGVVIVFSLEGSDVVTTTRRTVSPAATMTLGGLALVAAVVLGTGHDPLTARRRRDVERGRRDKGPPRWQRALQKGSPRLAFVVGSLLTLPGASYMVGLSRISKLGYSPAATVVLIVVFNLIMLGILEVALLSFVIAPEWTPSAIDRAKAWAGPHARRVVVTALTTLGALLIIKGLIELLG